MNRRRWLAGAAVIAVAVGASACTGEAHGLSLARQACGHVDSAAAYTATADSSPDAATAAALNLRAYDELRSALPIAAQAAYADGRWQALMTALSETNRVPVALVLPALTAECRQANSNTPDLGATTIPPPATSTVQTLPTTSR